MNRIGKRLLISCFTLTFMFCLLFSNIKTNARWTGPSSIKEYNRPIEEMRAVWVATVGNLNINRQLGTTTSSIDAWKKQYIKILDDAEANNLNTIIFQVRPANDAFYPSKYNPWSEYLVSYGVDPGWDPLAWMIEVTHERGLEYHAWLNPYRVTTDKISNILDHDKIIDVDINNLNNTKDRYFGVLSEKAGDIDNPIKLTGDALHHDVVIGAEGLSILNPASQNVRTHIENTINEIVENYDIDGIHFDDYFYPNDTGYSGSNYEYKGYTYSLEPWVDMKDYKDYLTECSNTGSQVLSIYDWRRENVNILIKKIGENIRLENEEKKIKCAFGISPAARYAPTKEVCSSQPERGVEGGMEGSCYNYYSYSDLYADTYKWAKEEWIDYITPQIYTNLESDYNDIIKWWNEALEGSNTRLYVGTALYLVGNDWGNGVSEMNYQIQYNNSYMKNVSGYFIFSYSSLSTQLGKLAMNTLVNYAWKYNALTPLYPHYQYEKQVKNNATVERIFIDDNIVTVYPTEIENAKGYAIYEMPSNGDIDFQEDLKNIFTNKYLVGLQINANHALKFTKKDNCQYYLVTYDSDNSIYSDFEHLNLYNEAPTVKVELDKDKYIYNEKVKMKVLIEDNDSSSYILNVAYAPNGSTFNYSVCSNVVINEKQYELEYQIPEISAPNGKFEVTVIDSFNTVKEQKDVKVISAPPVVNVNTINDVYVNNNVECTFNVSDDGFGRVTYVIYLSTNDEAYVEVSNGKARNEEINFIYYFGDSKQNCQFKIVVSDTENEVTILSNKFNILENEVEVIDPTPEKPENPIKENSGCKCKKNSNLIMQLTIIFSLTIIVLRKKER